MARRISAVLLAGGIALALVLPLVGVFVMVGAGMALAIRLEHDLIDDERQDPRHRSSKTGRRTSRVPAEGHYARGRV